LPKENIITIIGKNQARVGFKFLFLGYSNECEDCEFRKACLNNLEQNRAYEVVKITKKKLECKLHGAESRVVEVTEKPVEVAVESRIAIQDAIIKYDQIKCDFMTCENYKKCIPIGLSDGDKCKIFEVIENIECPKGNELTLISLSRQS
jgi:uncharacterized protein (UPF0179 family)